MWDRWVIDATMGWPPCFCPIEGDLDGECTIVTGFNVLGAPPPHGTVVGIVHADGQEAANAFHDAYRDEIGALLKPSQEKQTPSSELVERLKKKAIGLRALGRMEPSLNFDETAAFLDEAAAALSRAEAADAEIKPPNAPGDDCTAELAVECAVLRKRLANAEAQRDALAKELAELASAAECIRHWHDAMRDDSGMVVSKEHVFALWEQTKSARRAIAAAADMSDKERTVG